MRKGEHLRAAAVKLEEAIAKLQMAKQDLLAARNEQHVRLAMELASIEEVYDILTDPECTPEILDREESE